MTALRDEWGETLYDLNVNIAKEAAAASGASEELIAKLAMAFDPDKGDALVIKFFNQIGQKRGLETPFVSGDGQVLGLGATTPEAAKARITELKSDPEWVAKFNTQKHNSDSPIMKEYRGLISLAAKLMD